MKPFVFVCKQVPPFWHGLDEHTLDSVDAFVVVVVCGEMFVVVVDVVVVAPLNVCF